MSTGSGPVDFPACAATPAVSIVIPVFNQVEYTEACLRAVAVADLSRDFEVIVVDDCSTDGTSERLRLFGNLRILRNARNIGFSSSCNRGAASASGNYLVFLNNDTLVQRGWLDALLATFETFPDTGLTGAKLVYPDGRLQEAGGILYADGRAGNYGRFDAPLDPRYEFVREVDYCSGAAIALPASLFLQLGGFDARYDPAYYEDADLAMRVRDAGYKVRYQPKSVVVHFEGISAGTDEETGIKRHQRLNRQRFFDQWAEQLCKRQLPFGSPLDVVASRQPRILWVWTATGLPEEELEPSLEKLQKTGVDISLRVEHAMLGQIALERLRSRGIEVWTAPWNRGRRGWIRRYGRRFQEVYVDDINEADEVARLFARYAPGIGVLKVDPDGQSSGVMS